MDFSLTDEQRMLRENIIRFARQELNDGVAQRDRDQIFLRRLWQKCAEVGIQGLPVPEESGGSGLDPLSCAIALEALGYGCHDGGLVFSLCAHLLSCVVPIWKFGNEEQKRRYLTRLCDGSLVGVHAMTEPESGSDAFALRTRAERDGSGFRLYGTKMFITNGPVADLVIVFAMTDPKKGYYGGVTAFLVEKGTPGFNQGQKFEKMGLRTSPIGELVFENVYVSAEAVLGGIGGGSTLFTHAMDWERICLFASHVGTMEYLLDKAIEYARSRTQFGQPIGKFQAVSHRIAEMKAHLEAARLLTYKAAWNLDRARSVSLDAAITKLFVSESLVKAALATVQVYGGYGFMTDYEVERILRDAVGSTIYSGTSEMQKNIIARWLGL
ncbi:MAG: acyl-CoA dehydrogenase family protein [Acidobacteria bacterium]|nr:acyl-CoA dehydrogenase family protein [Acidobacteriota bacterium]MCI0718268.1 acyl-CoA dehydrogenase family protein [Acidobacteriota bacterium]